ncbi:hypothetical protein BJY52DRAFT_62175 [Lactarius psammicola]|nr:hypothetical protein BJY52DRAFT_62175 [Lactarius psammicola]
MYWRDTFISCFFGVLVSYHLTGNTMAVPGPLHWRLPCALYSSPHLLKRSLCCAAWRGERLLGTKILAFTRTFHDARCHLQSSHVLSPSPNYWRPRPPEIPVYFPFSTGHLRVRRCRVLSGFLVQT